MILIFKCVYLVVEEWFNSISYGFVCVVVIVGLVFMLLCVEILVSVIVLVVYGGMLIFMFLFLMIYYVVIY